MRGQTESSFQWIFASIAGIALLGFFLFLMRSCIAESEPRLNSAQLSLLDDEFSSIIWQGETVVNRTLPGAEAFCIDGVLGLRSGSEPETLRSLPIYLPPRIGGAAQIITREVAIGADTKTPVPLGSVLFIVDDTTSYLVVGNDAREFFEPIPDSPAIAFLDPNDIRNPQKMAAAVPRSASAVIVVTAAGDADLATAAVSEIKPSIRVLGVTLRPGSRNGGELLFFERARDLRLKRVGAALRYESPLLGLGGILVGERSRAMCAQDAFILRSRTITRVYENRSAVLATSPSIDVACSTHFADAATTLRAINTEPSDAKYLVDLFAAEDLLLYQQSSLRFKNCPGVA